MSTTVITREEFRTLSRDPRRTGLSFKMRDRQVTFHTESAPPWVFQVLNALRKGKV